MRYKFGLFVSLTLLLLQVNAQSISTNINGNSAELLVSLPGGIAADFTITFENVVGLTEENLGLAVDLIDLNDINVLNRLPSGILTSIPVAFPMMITVEPAYDSGLSFEGLVTIDIHTHNLAYTENTPLRLFKAPLGGTFRDITDTTSSGSYRARSTTGTFSQFIIVADNRAASQISTEKLNQLQSELAGWQNVIEPAVFLQLNNKSMDIAADINQANYAAADIKITEFSYLVSQYAGTGIPNVWRASKDIDNVAGELIAHAKTLKFSVRLID
ncbi:DUF6689 family protein [Marinicella litoralis]|nr:DUF6689 family protein [Marinicella litoralis]